MRPAKHLTKVNELIAGLASNLKLEAERLCRSGGIDVSEYDADQYILAKILVTASLRRCVYPYAPPNRWEKEIR